jgi:hypothetical protein
MDAVSSPWDENRSLQDEMSLAFSHDDFRRRFPNSPPLIFHGPHGWQVRQRDRFEENQETESHTDQLLATCAEVGVPLNKAILTESGRTTVGALLESSRRNFVADQELVWALIAYCGYLPHQPRWQNRFGEWHSYSDLARRIIAKGKGEGPCAGTHNHYVLAYMLRVDEQYPILDDRLRHDTKAFLLDSLDLLMRSQLPDGSWNSNWSDWNDSNKRHDQFLGRMDRSLLVTGHHLEWLILIPSNLEFDDISLRAAVRFVLRILEHQSTDSILDAYCPHSHAARVLSMIGPPKSSDE